MTAQPLTADVTPASRLRVVRAKTPAVSNRMFILMIAVLVILGLAGVMVVTTQVGAQSKELSALRRESTELGYTAAALTSQLQQVSSANALALRATQLGMVPNPYPAFIHLADGSVTGEPTNVDGDELPYLRGRRTRVTAPAAPVIVPEREAEAEPPADTAEGADSVVAAGAVGE